ncbi:hypothetical protein L6452_09740 [Arctium lappa]|uniref:Uncharacterized protein n=1 Tax=Arctium lappa TaxID=4217 RepID=A0ACB9DLB1_ARCLA|nr:hypothetical protein L6452_09740 [Arctium lappa]
MTAEVMQFNIKGDSNITVHKADKDKQDILRIKEHLQRMSSEPLTLSSEPLMKPSCLHLNIQRECLQSSDVVFRASDEAISDVFSEC